MNDPLEPVAVTESFVRLEANGTDERLHIDYVLQSLEPTRKQLLLRRALSLLASEETRLYNLSDAEAIAELDALKATQDKDRLTPMPPQA